MDVAIITALIAAVASLAGVFVKQYFHFKSKTLTYMERKQKQLTELFEPIEKVFFVYPYADPNWQFYQVFDIVKANLSIVPVSFLEEVRDCRRQKIVTKEKMDTLHDKASSYYNELRKILGYPYVKPPMTISMRLKFILELLVERNYVFWFVLIAFLLGLIVFVASFFIIDSSLFTLPEIRLISLSALIVSIASFLLLFFADVCFESTDY